MRDRKAYKTTVLHTNQPAQGPSVFFLKFVERAHENINRGGFLTTCARGWEWEKNEIDVLSFSFSPAGFARLVFNLRIKKENNIPTGYIQTTKQTNKRLIALFDILRQYHLLNDDRLLHFEFLP